MARLLVLVACALVAAAIAAPDVGNNTHPSALTGGKPNIVLFLTDDQDQMLGGSFPKKGGVTPMPKTESLMVDQGATATNWYIHTPICCPSRAELLTSRYFHNIKKVDECEAGYGKMPCCMHVQEQLVNNYTFAKPLQDAGYTVGMFGKYLNNCPEAPPPGYDVWLANGGGTYYSPEFSVSGLEWYGLKTGSWKGSKENYTTSVVGNASVAWINRVAGKGKPFFAYVAPKACHEPFLPAPWYAAYWDSSWPAHEPRPVSWNCSFESRKNHHHTIATEPLLSEKAAEFITTSFQNRWRTLMSVDDVIESVIGAVDKAGQLENTYFLYTSDHGFQLGEFNLPIDKRNAYEFDLRIHLLARGPGIKKGSDFPYLGTNVDVAPTILGLAGLTFGDVDGKSIVPLLVDTSATHELAPATKQHLATVSRSEVAANWRDSVFFEYYYVDYNSKCIPECHNIEDPSNNFISIRHLDGGFGNSLYTEYETSPTSNVTFTNPDFHEVYTMDNDEWQMNNVYHTTDKAKLNALHKKLHMWYNCKGSTCP